MTNLPDMAGAAAEIQLNGSTYRMRPLTIDDFAEFERWVDDAPIRQATRNLNGLSTDLQMKMLQQAQEAATVASQDDPTKRQSRITSQVTSMSGICYLIWLSLRREHPELTMEAVSQMLTLDKLPYVQQRLDAINGFSDPSPKRASQKAPRRRSKSK